MINDDSQILIARLLTHQTLRRDDKMVKRVLSDDTFRAEVDKRLLETEPEPTPRMPTTSARTRRTPTRRASTTTLTAHLPLEDSPRSRRRSRCLPHA